MISKIFLISVLFLLVTGEAGADFNAEKWQYSREIRVTGSQKLASFSLDNQVYEHAKEGLADLRIINNLGDEIKYKLTIESGQKTIETIPARIRDLGIKVGDNTQFIADLGRQGILHNSVTIQTSSVNFRRQVEVETSDDSANWLLAKKADEGSYIYDYSMDFKAKNTTVYYPQSTARFLRIKILDNGEEPIKVTGASVINDIYISSRTATYDPKLLETKNDQEKQTSTYLLDLGARGIPSNKISFSTKEVNFNREVLIEGSNDNNNFTNLAKDVIFSYQTPRFDGAKDSVTFSEGNFRYLRLTVFNRDNSPVKLTDFAVFGTVRKVIFEYALGETYKLFYGNPQARYPDYDIESYLVYFNASDVSAAVLGSEQENSSFVPEKAREKPLTERYPFLLPAVLVIGVLILGTMIAKLAFQVKKSR
ncbi:hypothetical protein A2W70_00265 [Candidatus Curtissbacteria bacterium RIFCSPLOWO2_02_41_11]|uniref:F5/8 type C domain-containing protein n=2 Tax=Candidatus Curtissiibacteriota TaxID=1752717 RepID=A0A1F5HQ13_9BACT|nr:MAG: hypothetical protein UU56_C0005G0028 [Candidatus Curtissbacteria bacterium GW2011_GWA2_41_24]OGE06257.1 MAG: hypothetical protein A2W70_00265 [Candidatus Curtissbacteria bacterium RIFCSPLOWO2_02_41_11]